MAGKKPIAPKRPKPVDKPEYRGDAKDDSVRMSKPNRRKGGY